MFKGLTGLKKVVKGGISAVAEHSSDLADKIITDPSTSQGHLKENLKKKAQGLVTTGEQISTDTHAKEKADEVAKVVNKVRHYGALGEDYLGYTDANKDIKKAVKAREKAAKKQAKAKKKKTGKKEDLFDPENLAKFKAELEERKRREAEFLQEKQESPDTDKSSSEVKLHLDLATTTQDSNQSSLKVSPVPTPLKSNPLSPFGAPSKTDTDDWKLFQSLTSGVDDLIKKKKEELEDIKQDSYFQKKPSATTPSADPDDLIGLEDPKKKKKWVDLDKAGFDDIDGSVSGSEDEQEQGEAADKSSEKSNEEEKEDDLGLVEIPDDDNESDDEDIFNTGLAEAIISGDIKLAVIPDDPVYDDDPFNTAYAEEIVKKEKAEKRKEANRIKFTGLSSVADVLSGKADKVDKSLIEHSTKRKRRRANRINLIGEDRTELTEREDIGVVDLSKDSDQVDILTNEAESKSEDCILEISSAPVASGPSAKAESSQQIVDLSEFEVLEESQTVQLTSNVAILAGEFSAPALEEEDDFDAAFDALAQESVTRGKLEDLEKQFEDTDVFDTTCAETVLNFASLTNKVEVIEEPLETFEDKDPFDTSAYESITGELETDLDFDTLAKRDPEADFKTTKKADIDDEFSGWDEVKPVQDQGWKAFEETKSDRKPSRPPPPKPPPPRPTRAPPKVHLEPRDAPSVVIKAPSTESIKSWNCATADILIKKSEIEALDAPALEEEEEDPFDTSNFEGIVPKEEKEDIEDPFDTSGFKSPEPEEKPDLLTALEEEVVDAPIVPALAIETDPFDTEFASDILPDKGDPFDTSYIKGVPGKAEIKALEEEFLTQEEFDPRTEEEGVSSRKVAPGSAGRARPKRVAAELQIKAPEVEEDPFDTTIVDKVIPVRKATQSSDLSVEDEHFDPTSTFESTKEEVDPFDTTIAGQVIPELADPVVQVRTPSPIEDPVEEKIEEPVLKEEEPPPPPPEAAAIPVKPKPVDEIARKIGRARPRKPLARQLTDEDFDPRS